MANDTVYAAGAVLWKVVDKELKILVVHRTQHKDISIPKGKVDPGETLPETAVREIHEETGLQVVLGPYLGTVDYIMPNNGKRKEVHYWAAEVDPTAAERSSFTSNDEIYDLEWMTISTAQEKLTYSHDIDLVTWWMGDRATEVYATNNQACIITPFILAGAMAPSAGVVTLDGEIGRAHI